MRIGFAGTPEFALPTLRALIEWCTGSGDASLRAVWTQPDRRAGRGRKLQASPVKRLALDMGVAVLQPRSLRALDTQRELEALDLDLLVVVAYGLILPAAVLAAPRLGCVNVHASLLPRWRGAAPVARAIEAGDTVSGVAIMQMDAGLDTGALWRRAVVPIAPDASGGDLHDRLAATGARELLLTLPLILAGAPPPQPQDDSFVTYARKLTKDEARIDWRQSATVLHNKIRAFDPWPVADTQLGGRQLRVWRANVVAPPTEPLTPGTIFATDGALNVACGAGALCLTRVQLAGGKAINGSDLVNAQRCAGRVLGLPRPP